MFQKLFTWLEASASTKSRISRVRKARPNLSWSAASRKILRQTRKNILDALQCVMRRLFWSKFDRLIGIPLTSNLLWQPLIDRKWMELIGIIDYFFFSWLRVTEPIDQSINLHNTYSSQFNSAMWINSERWSIRKWTVRKWTTSWTSESVSKTNESTVWSNGKSSFFPPCRNFQRVDLFGVWRVNEENLKWKSSKFSNHATIFCTIQ